MSEVPTTIRAIGWVDMVTADPGKISTFYKEVFGFGIEPCEEDENHTSYSMLGDDGKPVIGICDKAMFPNWVGGWVLYINVDNYEERIANIESSGGEIVDQMSYQGKRHCLTKDPSGAGVMLCEV